MKTRAVKDLVGEKSGELTVASYSHTLNKNSYWNCRCSCGKSVVVKRDYIVQKDKKSCGCLTNKWKSEAKLGDKNPIWVGDKIEYTALHNWVRRRVKPPLKCPSCGDTGVRIDLANISQEYKRDLSDWEYLCRKCHMTKDGRLEQFKLSRWTKGNIKLQK